MSAVAVIEVHKAEDGVWDSDVRHVLNGEDLETLDSVDGLKTTQASVRIQGQVKLLTVYLDDEDDGWVTWQDAF